MWGILCIFDPEFIIKEERMRFLGNIEAKIDAKGSIFLPSAFRKVLEVSGEETLVLRKDVFQPCLVLYPQSIWDFQLDTLRQKLNRWNPEHQQILRQFVFDAEQIALDGNGRFLIPKRFLDKTSLGSDVRFVGMDDTIEIWNGASGSTPLMDSKEFGEKLSAIMANED